MATEDSLKEQGDIAAAVTYSPANIPMGSGYQTPAQIAAQPAPAPVKGYTAPAIVTSRSQIILPADSDRQFILIQNADPAGDIFVSFGAEASLSIGIKVAAGGGGLLLDNHCPTSAVSAIGNIATNPFVTIVSA